MADKFKSNIQKPTDLDVLALQRGRPFGKCRNCGIQEVSQGQPYCWECKRLVEIGFGPTPRGPKPAVADPQEVQSHDAFDHSGYQDKIPNSKFPPDKERM